MKSKMSQPIIHNTTTVALVDICIGNEDIGNMYLLVKDGCDRSKTLLMTAFVIVGTFPLLGVMRDPTILSICDCIEVSAEKQTKLVTSKTRARNCQVAADSEPVR